MEEICVTRKIKRRNSEHIILKSDQWLPIDKMDDR